MEKMKENSLHMELEHSIGCLSDHRMIILTVVDMIALNICSYLSQYKWAKIGASSFPGLWYIIGQSFIVKMKSS